MIYTLKNDKLKVEISSLGAQIMSVSDGECEYIWQGDERYWANRTPLVFPVCGRFFTGKYTYEGKEYEMGCHGFARSSEFEVEEASDSKIVFSLKENETTLAQYPFAFKLTVSYELEGNTVSSVANIKNTGNTTLPATFGAHPGFNVPLDNGSFEDWYVEFSEDCTPNELVQSPTCFLTGKKKAYGIENSRIIRLRHSLFDIDSIFFDKVAPSATLKSDKSGHSVTLNYAGMPYLGLWHKPRSDAPYICIEPWCGLPSYDGQVDDLSTKHDLFHILPNKEQSIKYQMIFR